MNIGIVGAEEKKFTPLGAIEAQQLIDSLIAELVQYPNPLYPHSAHKVVSGHCHLGGVDIWAEAAADEYHAAGCDVIPMVFPPHVLSWSGYRPRNVKIAKASDTLHCIAVRKLPPGYEAKPFEGECCHCKRRDHIKPYIPHIKSGGCWTMWYAYEIGKSTHLHIIDND